MVKLFIGERSLLARFVEASRLSFPNQRRFVGSGCSQIPVEAVETHIELAAWEPLGKGFFPAQNFGPWFEPEQLVFGSPAPEFFRRTDRFVVQLTILGQGLNLCLFGKLFGWRENTVFLKDRRNAGRNLGGHMIQILVLGYFRGSIISVNADHC